MLYFIITLLVTALSVPLTAHLQHNLFAPSLVREKSDHPLQNKSNFLVRLLILFGLIWVLLLLTFGLLIWLISLPLQLAIPFSYSFVGQLSYLLNLSWFTFLIHCIVGFLALFLDEKFLKTGQRQIELSK